MRVGQDVLTDLRAALATEWVFPHGTGGSSSGTACGTNARRTHALLTAAGPHGRLTTLLLKMDERLRVAGATWEPGCHVVAGDTARPAGPLLLESFTLDPWPLWTWRGGEILLEKALLPISGHDAVAIRYRLLGGPAATLAVSPLVVSRDPTALQRESPEPPVVQGVPGRIQIQLEPERPPLVLWHNGTLNLARVWRHGLACPLDPDAEEGEDAYVHGHIEAALSSGAELHVVAATDPGLFRSLAREDRLGTPPPRTLAECVRILESCEREQHAERERQAIAAAAVTARQAAAAREGAAEPGAEATPRETETRGDDPWTRSLAGILLSGLVRSRRGLTIVSTLPAAQDRVVETLRAVPALLSLRAFDAAREILAVVVERLDHGLAPEAFDPDDGTARYGDPAPALWLVHAAELYARRSDDLEFVRRTLFAPIEGVMQSYRSGTQGGIRVDADGLLAAGESGAKRADLNALWYHALVAMAQLAKKSERKEAAAFYLAWAREHQARFNEVLWDEKRGALFEAIVDGAPVRGLSPAQLLAVRIAPPVLAPERAPRLLETLERALFTPLGLRERPGETRAHTAWLAPFCSAYLRAHGRSPESQARVRSWLAALGARLARASCGALPEWFEVPPARAGRAGDGAARGARAATRRREPSEARDGAETATAANGASPEGAGPEGVAAPPGGGEPVSILAAAELLTLWIEELDPVTDPAAILSA